MAKQKVEGLTPRALMEAAVDEMMLSVQEQRDDKVSPKVGAILQMPDGTIDKAHRGELREGDHAEFTLLERKHRINKLDGSTLYATLEPCAPGARKHPKLGCAERIVNARIKKVFIGIEDPDPLVDRKGIKYLIDKGIEVEMFPPDLQDKIREANKQFIKEALQRAKTIDEQEDNLILTNLENIAENSLIEDLSEDLLKDFIKEANLKVALKSPKFNAIFSQLGLLEKVNDIYKPTGLGLLLFGIRPQLSFPNALIRTTFKTKERREDIKTIEGPLILQADETIEWFKKNIGKQTDRSEAHRKELFDYPPEVIREAIINAIVHRDYDLEGAAIYLEINDDAIIIKSPGKPVDPIKIEQIKQFDAPSLSRNPKIVYVFDQMKLVEQRGLGFETIKNLPVKYGIPLPIVEFQDPFIVFKFPRRLDNVKNISSIKNLDQLSNQQLKGYEWLRTVDMASTREYSAHFDIGYRTAQRHLSKMKELDLIQDNGDDTNSPNYKYMIKQK